MAGIVTLVVFLCGVAAGYLLRHQFIGGDKVDRQHYDALMQEKTTLTTRLETLEQLRREHTELHERALKAEAYAGALEKQLQQQQEQLRLEFKNISTSIFEEFSGKFTTQSEEKIGVLLNPLRERLNEFQKLVGDSFSAQGKEQHTLKSEIEKIVLQTDSLTRALRGDVKAQGNWGEVMLERILEDSGLRHGEDYIVQGEDMALVNEDGGRQQPDVIVRLPDDKHIIIDAKVSLTAYERYCTEPDETAREAHMREFLKSVKTHVNGLEAKRYQYNDKLGTPDFVLMFMPIEGAYSFAIQQDQELHAYAWGKKIVLVCPATLFASLRTIASLWRIEQQNKNAQEIARQGAKLYDKFTGFVTDMETIGKQLGYAQRSYDEACNKLYNGRGNLIGQAEKLKELGVKPSKSLPKGIQGEETDEMPADALPQLSAVPG